MFTPTTFSGGDRGGNRIIVRSRNLHSLWDNLLGNPRTTGSVHSRAMTFLEEAGEYGPPAARNLKPVSWIKESHELAQTTVYDRNIRAAIRAAEESGQRDEVRVVVDEDYRRNAGHLARRRAVQAGFRLARLLSR